MTLTDTQEKVLDQVSALLGEHFDAALVLVSMRHERDTAMAVAGAGNFFARLGMAREFLLVQDERSRQAQHGD